MYVNEACQRNWQKSHWEEQSTPLLLLTLGEREREREREKLKKKKNIFRISSKSKNLSKMLKLRFEFFASRHLQVSLWQKEENSRRSVWFSGKLRLFVDFCEYVMVFDSLMLFSWENSLLILVVLWIFCGLEWLVRFRSRSDWFCLLDL